MNTRIKNLQGNLFNKDQTAVYGSNAMTSAAKSIVAKVNDLLKKVIIVYYLTQVKNIIQLQVRLIALETNTQNSVMMTLL